MENRAAILVQSHEPLVVKDTPPPERRSTEVLVRVKAVATNAADWKVYEGHFPQSLPTLLGCDIVGDIVDIGESVTGFSIGDRVAGFTQQQMVGMQAMVSTGSVPSDLRHGGYQKLVPMLPRMVFKVPSSVPDEAAATFGCSFFTAATAVFRSLGHPYPTSSPRATEKVLVWGASSAVGAFAVQLLKASNAEVIAVCSAKNFDYVRDLGASHLVDYRGSDVAAEIKSRSLHPKLAIDAISSSDTCSACLDIVGEGGKVANVQFLEALRRPGIELHHTNVVDIVDDPLLESFVRDWTPTALISGALKAVQFQVYSGGLDVIDQAIRDHRDNKISRKGVVIGI